MKSRSIFWPLVLIAVGFVWLLINLGVVPSINLWALYSFVPYFILVLGVSLVLRALWEPAGRIVSSLAIGLAVLAVVFAASLGWNKAPEWDCFGFGSSGTNCNWFIGEEGSIPGSGVVVSESRSLPEFTSVSVDFPCEVIIRQGEAQSVLVEAEDNLLPQLETRVANGLLYIERSNIGHGEWVNPNEMVRVTLTVRDLNRLDFSIAGSVTIEGLQTNSLSISMSGAGEILLSELDVQNLEATLSGAGNIEAAGKADNLQIDVSGMGSFEGGDLATQTAEADISGMGSATLWVAQQLTAGISGTGSIDYYGSPHVEQSISGLGSVQSLGEK